MTKNSLKIKVEIYAVFPYFNGILEDKIKRNRFDNLISEMVGLSTSFISIQRVLETDSVNELIDKEHRGLFTVNTILKFTYESDYSSSEPSLNQSSNPELAKAIFTSNMEGHAINFLFCKISNLVTCANISMPGVLAMKKCFIYKDEEYIRTVDLFGSQNTIQNLYSSLSKELYEKKIDFLKIVNWFNKINVNDGCSANPLGRAIGCLNHLLFSDMHESNATIWTLVAIEALYCRENDIGKSKQIIDKATIIISTLKNPKDLKKMYAARSDFLHGDVDFPLYPSLPAYIPLDIDKNKSNQQNKHLHTALNLMFETLQYMVINSRYDLIFKRGYTLS